MANKVGLIGVGAMGRGVASSLQRAGFAVYGSDVSKQALDDFAAKGGNACAHPAEVASQCDVVILLVVNAAQTEGVLFGENGVASTMAAGGVVVASATVAPEFATQTAERLKQQNIMMIDSPVSGGVAGAAAGKLTLMSAGPEEAYVRCSKIFEAYAAKVYRLGEVPGTGSKFKLLNNLLCGVHIAVAAEAMALGMKSGVDPAMLYDVITHSAGNSWAFQDRMPHVVTNDFTPVTALSIFVKDLRLVLQMAREADFNAPITSCAASLFEQAAEAGLAGEDDTAVIKMFDGWSP